MSSKQARKPRVCQGANDRPCPHNRTCRPNVNTKVPRCASCKYEHENPALAKVAHDTATAPTVPPPPRRGGEWIISSDWHVPYHWPAAVMKLFEVQELLNIPNLCIAGDFIHVDALSKFLQRAKQPSLGEEALQAKLLLDALATRFDRIEILPGNHDHRAEKSFAKMAVSVAGRQALEVIAALMGLTNFTPEDLALSFFETFFDSGKVKVHTLSDMTINDTWFVQHPGTARKAPASSEREFCTIKRKSVLQGHPHTFAVTFDASGKDVAMTIGSMCDGDKFRYPRERPKPFPAPTWGFAAILTDSEHPEGRLLPIAVHDRWFDLAELARRLRG